MGDDGRRIAKPMPEISGHTLRAYREKLQLSQHDLAELLDVTQSTISMVEIGRNTVSRKLLRSIKECGDRGKLTPTFDEFLRGGGLLLSGLETEFNVIGRVPLHVWQDRLNLKQPPDQYAAWIALPGIPTGARAFQFIPPPSLIAPDTIVIFRPAKFDELVGGHITLVQLGKRQKKQVLKPGIACFGRTILAGRGRTRVVQFEAASADVPVLKLDAGEIDVLMVCCFRGRHGSA